MNWLITDKGDQDVRILADGHYSRRTVGSRQFCRNGQNLVFVTQDLKAAWITFRPTPGVAKRQDHLDAWECALFRNTGPLLSSSLIREAVLLSCALWGPFPKDGMITYVKADAVQTTLKGYCYRRAGWIRPPCTNPKCQIRGSHKAHAADGKPMFRAPRPAVVPLFTEWSWRGERGGKLRRDLVAA